MWDIDTNVLAHVAHMFLYPFWMEGSKILFISYYVIYWKNTSKLNTMELFYLLKKFNVRNNNILLLYFKLLRVSVKCVT